MATGAKIVGTMCGRLFSKNLAKWNRKESRRKKWERLEITRKRYKKAVVKSDKVDRSLINQLVETELELVELFREDARNNPTSHETWADYYAAVADLLDAIEVAKEMLRSEAGGEGGLAKRSLERANWFLEDIRAIFGDMGLRAMK